MKVNISHILGNEKQLEETELIQYCFGVSS